MIIDENFNFDDLSILNEKKIIIRNIKDIPFGLFMNSGVKEVIIEEGTESIGDYAFSRNNIETIVLPHSLKSIGNYAFSNNKLEHINFNDNLISIKNKAFSNNPIKEVELPNSLCNIGLYVFPSDTIVMYDNKKFDVSLINQFDNFIETYKIIMKMIPDFDFNKVNINIVLMLCEKNDLIKLKSYWYNKNNFEILYDSLKKYFGIINVRNLFKICYILGYFSSSKEAQKNKETFIKNIYFENEKEKLESYVSALVKIEYYPKLEKLIVNNIKDDYFISVFQIYYNNYKRINRGINIRKKEKIRKECIKRTKLRENGYSIDEVQKKIKKLRDELNEVSYDDLIEYFDNSFDTKHQELKSIISLLSGYITKYDFKKLERLYENANLESVFSYIKGTNNEFEYEWLKGNDPRLYITGYLTNCCFGISMPGEDILVQSVVNPCIKTMVIYYFGKMIGKTTCYYNKDEKYLIFNNIEMSNKFIYSLNVSSKERLNALKTIVLGIKEQVKDMEKRGLMVNDIRIGMNNNDLYDEVKECYKITNNMLLNYNYHNYEGDANSKNGQAIVVLR